MRGWLLAGLVAASPCGAVDRVCQRPELCKAAFDKLVREYNDPANPDPVTSLTHMKALRQSIADEISWKNKNLSPAATAHRGSGSTGAPSGSRLLVEQQIMGLRGISSTISAFVASPPPPGKAKAPPPAGTASDAGPDPVKYGKAAAQEMSRLHLPDRPGGAAGAPAGASPRGSPAQGDAPATGRAGGPAEPPSRPLEPPTSQDFQEVGRAYMDAGAPQDAARVLDAGVKAAPGEPGLYALRAQARLASGDKEAAVEDARRALSLDPGNETARLIAGYGDVSGGAQKALSNGPDFRTAEAGTPAAGAGPGGAHGGAGRAPASLPAAGARMPVPTSPAVESLLRSAAAKAGLRDSAGALVDLAQALETDPKSKAARLLRAEILNGLGQYEAALKDAEEVLKAEPDDPRALRAKAYALLQLGRVSEALEAARRATELEPGNGLGWLYRAMAEERLGLTEEAAAHYRRAMELDATLTAAAQEALKRLAAASGRAAPPPLGRGLAVRWGLAALAAALILAGVLGTAGGRRAVTRGGLWLTGRGGAPSEDDAPAFATLAPGATLGGHFQIVRELGRGGMGVVYEAEDLALQRRVAIKQLHGQARESPQELARFLTEARLVAKLRHPNLAEILTVLDDGGIFLVFEYLEGMTLDRLLARQARLTPAETRGLVAEVCAALDFAHGRKIIHRDLKPANVMVLPEGTCKVMDLGIAHQASGHDSTRTSAAGTPPYMAPEQMMGSVSRAADIYALGVMTYELLAGARPFSGPNFLDQKLDSVFSPISQVAPALPPGLDTFFRRVLAPDPRQRPQTAADFLKEFDQALRP